MVEKPKIGLTKDMPEPLRISVRNFAFRKEGEHVVLDVEYWVNGVHIQPLEETDGTAIRPVKAANVYKSVLTVPLFNLENGESLYIKYVDILEDIRGLAYNKEGIEDNDHQYKVKLNDRLKTERARYEAAKAASGELPEVLTESESS